MNNQVQQKPPEINNEKNDIKTNAIEPSNAQTTGVDSKLAVAVEPEVQVPVETKVANTTPYTPLISKGLDLVAYYNMSTTQGPALEEPTFKIDPSGTTYAQKYLDKIDVGASVLYPAGVDVDPFFDITDDLGNGRLMGLNDNPNYQHRTYCRPGIVNSVPVHIQATNITWFFNLPEYPTVKGHLPPSIEERRTMCWEHASRDGAMAHWAELPDFNPAQGEDLYGGPTFTNNPGAFVYRISNKEICSDNESYISAAGADFERLNVDANTVKDVFYNFKLANIRFNNNRVRDLYSFCYNYGRRDPLAYNAFLQQLKLVAYTDQVATVYDHIENWNSNCPRRFLMNKDDYLLVNENINHGMAAYTNGNIGWCTQQQYQEYLAKNEELAGWADGIDWYFVPIKFQSLQADNLPLGIYTLSLFPYPVCTVMAQGMEVNGDQSINQVTCASVWFEPLSAKLDMDGHPNICYVIVDAPENLETDPQNPGFQQAWFRFATGGQSLNIDNLFHDRSDEEEDFDSLKEYLVELLDTLFNEGDLSEAWMMEEFNKVDSWQLSPSVLEFLAYLTTMPVNAYKSSRPSVYLPNLQNVSLIPMDTVMKLPNHVEIDEPSYIQRCYHLLGLVRQRSQVFITNYDYAGFRRIMYGTRMALGACCSKLLADARNEISAKYHTDNDTSGLKWTLRRRQFGALFESTFLKSSAILRPGIIGAPKAGIMKYIVPERYPMGTLASMGEQTNIREYCNVSDWVRLMTDTISVKEQNYYATVPPDFKEHGTIINLGRGLMKLSMTEVGRKPTDQIGQFINKIIGRTGFGTPYLYWGHLSGQNMDVLNEEMYEPYYITGQYSWSCDPWVQTPEWVYTGFIGQQLNLPAIRVLDYIYPVVDLSESIPMSYYVSDTIINRFISYMVVNEWNAEPIHSYNDYSHVPGLAPLNSA